MSLDIREITESAFHSPSGAARMIQVAEDIVRAAALDAATAGEVAGDTAAVAAAASIADALVIGIMVVICVAAFLVLMAVSIIVETIANLFRRIPWVGGSIANALLFVFDFRTGTLYTLNNVLASLVPQLWKSFETVVGYFADKHAQKTDAIKPTVHGVNVAAVNNALGRLQSEINTLRNEIGAINAHTGHVSGTPLPSDIATLPEQMQYLQAQIHTLYQNQLASYQTMSQLVTTVNELERAYRELYHATVGIRTVELGWQDIVTQIQDQERKTRDIDARQSTELHHHASSIAELSPLALLLEPGIAGLRNLRKLEDDPCQCPKFGGIGGDMGTALATLLWVENG